MIFHRILLTLPWFLRLTYSHDTALKKGTRVSVRLRGKKYVGIVWATHIAADIDPTKIKPIEEVFDDGILMPDDWFDLIEFTARYYHYPLGATAFAALPSALRQAKKMQRPIRPCHYRFCANIPDHAAPKSTHQRLWALWQGIQNHQVNESNQRLFHPQAKKYLHAWQQQGFIESYYPQNPRILSSPYPLNDEQQQAYENIHAHLMSYHTFLLYGITGSGKTEVYFEVMADVFRQQRQVLFLLPEINLTEQLIQRLQQRFPQLPIATLNSRSSMNERYQHYLQAQYGDVSLIVGTRLAVFTPFKNLGLIVVDEEHDASFKQDSELRYHARDLAIWRAKQLNCPIILGSATPSLESFQAALKGRYQLLRLKKRAKNATLPTITLLDIRHEKTIEGISQKAYDLLRTNLSQQGLSLVYLNRRGFSPALFCKDCGYIFSCPNCSAHQVWHKNQKQLRCHYCNFRQSVPRACPQCGNQDLTAIGLGTQRIEEALTQAFPTARIHRIDRDSVRHKEAWATSFHAIDQGDVDIIIGTQMLAKGHDFSKLNLIIVVNADHSLFSADFRAPEHLFGQLMQVAGRAGRDQSAGQVLIQTELPNHPVLQAVLQQDYETFAKKELAERQAHQVPPFVHVIALRADAPQLQDAFNFLQQVLVQSPPPPPLSFLGPAPQLMVKLANRERAQIFIESPSRAPLHRYIQQVMVMMNKIASLFPKLRWSVNVDPQDC